MGRRRVLIHPEVKVCAMSNPEFLSNLFPRAGEISPEDRPPAPVHQRRYLLDGELKSWAGPVQTVLSAVCVRDDDGQLKQVELGSYPVGGVEEAEEALSAAVAAYDEHRGVWPTM